MVATDNSKLVEATFKELPGTGEEMFRQLYFLEWELRHLPADFYRQPLQNRRILDSLLDKITRLPRLLPAATHLLVQLVVNDCDFQLRGKALRLLRKISDQSQINAICRIWVATRQPDLETLLVEKRWVTTVPIAIRVPLVLKMGLTDILTGAPPTEDIITTLVQALNDEDAVLIARATACLRQLAAHPLAREYMAQSWWDNRSPLLVELLAQYDYPAALSPELQLWLDLKLGKFDAATPVHPVMVASLVQAAQDPDAQIGNRARQVLRQLRETEAQQELCRIVIRQDLPFAEAIAVEQGYLPVEAYEKALFYFVTGQLERYDSFDFDRRILTTAYNLAEPAFRRRLAEKVRAVGRVEYLEAITGASAETGFGSNTRLEQLDGDESGLVVQILAANGEWEKLWQLVFGLPLVWSLQATRLLVQSHWQPANGEERLLLRQLGQLCRSPFMTAENEVRALLPLALPKARLKAGGRVNDLAFSPNTSQPTIAVATGQGKVLLWNVAQARLEKRLDRFNHSVGHLAFTPGGRLIMAERAAKSGESSGVYSWYAPDNFTPNLLGQHTGAILALAHVEAETVATFGRDDRLVLWGTERQQELAQTRASHWEGSTTFRSLCVGSKNRQIALVGREAKLLNLANLEVKGQAWLGSGQLPAQVVRFTPDETELLLGQPRGDVFLCSTNLDNSPLRPLAGLTGADKDSAVCNLVYTPDSERLIIGWGNGQIEFYDWLNRRSVGKIEASGKALTSLSLSTDGAFMATGDRDGSFRVWDLRLNRLPKLFSRPLAQAEVSQLAALLSLKESGVGLTPALQNSLNYLEIILQQRLRFAIELDEMPNIQAGDFDIELEG